MPADTLVPVTIQLPAAVLDELTAAVAAQSGPSIFGPNRRSRSAAVKSAVEAFVLDARAKASAASPAAPIPRQRSRAMAVPPQPIIRRAAG